MFRHILVPTDFSAASERAEATALELARRIEARVTLLHVWMIPDFGYAEALSWPTDGLEEAAARSLAAACSLARKTLPSTDTKLVIGVDWERILEAVGTESADLVVMGTHGRRGLKRLLLGSVAERVVRFSPVPVLTVGPAASADHAHEGAAGDRP